MKGKDMQNTNKNNDYNEVEKTAVLPEMPEQVEDVSTEDEKEVSKTITIFSKTFPKKKVIITAAVCAALVAAAIGGGILYSTSAVPEEAPVETQGSPAEDFETGEAYLPIEVTAEGWEEETSTPVIAHIVSEDGEVDFYHAFDANEQADIAVDGAGVYEVSFISPINGDGSIYRVGDPVTVDTGNESDVETGKVTFEKIPAADTTADELTNIIKDISEAVKKGDETLMGENGVAIIEKAETNAKANTNVDADAVTEATKEAETAVQETDAGDTGAKKDNASGSDVNNGSGSSNVSSGGSSKANSSSGSSSANTSNSSNAGKSESSSHTHNWVTQTETRHHDAVTHQVWHDAVKEVRHICNNCKADITGNENSHMKSSLLSGGNCGSYHTEYITIKEGYYETVTDKAAYDETVTNGRKCSICNAWEK